MAVHVLFRIAIVCRRKLKPSVTRLQARTVIFSSGPKLVSKFEGMRLGVASCARSRVLKAPIL